MGAFNMEHDKKITLVDALHKIADIREKQKELDEKVGEYAPPEKKSMLILDTGAIVKPITFGLISIVCIAVCIFLVLSTASSINPGARVEAIIDNPGEEYNTWIALWDDVNLFEELEDDWSSVESAWAEKGVNVSWNFVHETYKGMSGTFSADYFTMTLNTRMETELVDSEISSMTTKTFIAIGLAIAFIVFLVLTIKNVKDIPEYFEAKKTNKARQNYNRNVYPKLLAEYEAEDSKRQEQFNNESNRLKKELSKAIKTVESLGGHLPERCYDKIYDITACLLRNADSLADAIATVDKNERERQEQKEREREERRERRSMSQSTMDNAKRIATQEREKREANQRAARIRTACHHCRDFDTCSSKYRPDCAKLSHLR